MKTTHNFTLDEIKEILRLYKGLSREAEIVIENIERDTAQIYPMYVPAKK